MISTTPQLISLTKKLTPGRIIIYPSSKNDQYVLIHFASSTLEWVKASVIKKMQAEKMVVPFLAYTVDAVKIKEKGGAAPPNSFYNIY